MFSCCHSFIQNVNMVKLKQIRTLKGMTLKELSLKSGISSNYLCELEQGKYNPTASIICALCKALQVEPNDLLDSKYWK